MHSSKASGATPAGALTCPRGENFTHSRIKSSTDQFKWPQQHNGDIPSGSAMVLEVTMICIDNSEWPPHCFSNDKPLPWINLLRQRSPEHSRSPTGQTKIPMVNARVTPSRSQASAGLILIPTKARGLLSGTITRDTLTRGLNHT